jgi:adenine-specific DNA-methyltransferase
MKQTPMTEPEKLDLRSHDAAGDKIAELLRLFPEVRTEGGKLDFDRLKLALGEAVDVGKERYGMNWPGKADCFDTTENLIIEGDNLEVLKLLQKSYLGKVKMIYIDPPYNTGNDFIYPDNYAESLQTYLEYTGQVDEAGTKFGTNPETDGRFHSKWMNMMYPRLYLGRNLLRDDGVIFISVDEHEVDNLRKLCHEIFGEENALGVIVWKGATDNNPTQIAVEHEYLLCFARTKDAVESVWKNSADDAKTILLAQYNRLKANEAYEETDIQRDIRTFIKANREALAAVTHYDRVDAKGVYTGSRKVHNPKPGGYKYDVMHPVTKQVCIPPVNGYRYPKERMDELLAESRILFGEDENQIIQIKEYLHDYEGKLSSVIHLDSRTGSNELNSLFGIQKLFPNPKPVSLLKSVFEFVLKPGELFLDFFAGSGASAQAVFELNEQDGGKRNGILVQLPEPTRTRKDNGTWDESAAWKAGYKTIAEITKERVRRVIKNFNEQESGKLRFDAVAVPDRGFRVFTLSESNFTTWDAQVAQEPKALEKQLEFHVDHIREGRTAADILYELLLKSGFPLTTPVEKQTFAGKTIYIVAGGALVICLERELTLELIRAIAGQKPERVVFLDEGFAGKDQLKANAVQTFKTKGVTSFKTV